MSKNEKKRKEGEKTDKLLERRRRKQCASRDCVTLMLARETEEESEEKRRRRENKKKKTKSIPSNKSCFHLNKEGKDNRLGYLGDQEDYFSMATGGGVRQWSNATGVLNCQGCLGMRR